MRKAEFLPTEVQSFQMKGTQDYHNLLQILQEEVQKIDHQIRENNKNIAQIEIQRGELEELFIQEKNNIQSEVTQLLKTLKNLPKTKETLSQRKQLKQQKEDLQAKSMELKGQINFGLPTRIQVIIEANASLEGQKRKLYKDIHKISTNPVAFTQTMKQKVEKVLGNLTFSESLSVGALEFEKQSTFYSKAVLDALKVAILPVDDTKFNIVGKGPSWGTVKSSLIPIWRDGGGTYNDIF